VVQDVALLQVIVLIPTPHVVINTLITTTHQFTPIQVITAEAVTQMQGHVVLGAVHLQVLVQLLRLLAITNIVTITQMDQSTTTQAITIRIVDLLQDLAVLDAVITMVTVHQVQLIATIHTLTIIATIQNILTTMLQQQMLEEQLLVLWLVVLLD